MDFRSSFFPIPEKLFPDTYEEGCQLWKAALGGLTLPVVHRDFTYPVAPGHSKKLVTQTAFVGAKGAPLTLVLIGATHGVEGFAGTAVQCDLLNWLAHDHNGLPKDLSLLLINGLNPWGYHYLHRFDHQGIDVNRNFIDFQQPLPDNPGYRHLEAVFKTPDIQLRAAALAKATKAMGERDYEIAVSGGQYSDPGGPFYGGDQKSHSRQVIERLMTEYQLSKKRLAVIDIHTGLGPYGYGEVICDHPAGSSGWRVARRWYGGACTSAEDGSSSSVPKSGLLDYAWHDIMDEYSCFVTLEFGTLGTESLFDVLLDDHNGDTKRRQFGSKGLRDHFYPNDPYWREAVIFRARQVIFQALSGIQCK